MKHVKYGTISFDIPDVTEDPPVPPGFGTNPHVYELGDSRILGAHFVDKHNVKRDIRDLDFMQVMEIVTRKRHQPFRQTRDRKMVKPLNHRGTKKTLRQLMGAK